MAKTTAKKTPSSTSTAPYSFTDTRRVKELIALMADNGLTEIELVEDKSRILLRCGGASPAAPMPHMPSTHHAQPASHAPAPIAPAEAAPPQENLITIKSPMVGTYYSAPNPESDAYVSIGSEVEKDQTVVGVIEAMKVFNEIHADTTGTIVKILVSNGQAVEYGQPMFLVKPN